MPLPPGWPTVQVYGTYLRLDGTPAVGSVWFETAQPVVVNNADGVPIGVLPRRQIATLDTTGSFAIALPCTDAGATPTGWTYQVSEKFDGGQPDYSIEVPVALVDQGINLAVYPHATPVPVNPPVVTYLTVEDIGTVVASQTDMQNAITIANNAATQAANAVTTANQAEADAGNALTVANGIAGTANTALANSNTAINTANQAQTTANGIAGTANTALANANAAVTTANQAQTDATNAVNTANGIAGTANTALTNANNAVATANAASTTANNAQTTANAALPATSPAVSAAKWTTARALSFTGDVTGTHSVDGSADVATALTIANGVVTGAKVANNTIAVANLSGTGSTAGQVPISNGAGVSPSWGFAPLACKNKLINGNFWLWRRGASLTVSGGGAYLADRWIGSALGASSAVFSQQSFALGQGVVSYEPTYFMRHVVTSVAGSTNGYNVQQRIEDVRTLAGQTATLGFWAKADAARNIAVEFSQNFGTGGSASVTGIGVTTFALTTAWQFFSVTVTLPSINSKILGSTPSTLQLNFWMDAGSSFNSRTNSLGQQSGTFDFAQCQLEPGSYATPFEILPFALQQQLAMRYYENSFPFGSTPAQNFGANTGEYSFSSSVSGASATVRGYACPFAVPKRATPTVTTYNPAAANANGRDKTANVDLPIAGTVVSTATILFSFSGVSSLAVGDGIGVHWAADAEL
jgi:hypothetical protein